MIFSPSQVHALNEQELISPEGNIFCCVGVLMIFPGFSIFVNGFELDDEADPASISLTFKMIEDVSYLRGWSIDLLQHLGVRSSSWQWNDVSLIENFKICINPTENEKNSADAEIFAKNGFIFLKYT